MVLLLRPTPSATKSRGEGHILGLNGSSQGKDLQPTSRWHLVDGLESFDDWWIFVISDLRMERLEQRKIGNPWNPSSIAIHWMVHGEQLGAHWIICDLSTCFGRVGLTPDYRARASIVHGTSENLRLLGQVGSLCHPLLSPAPAMCVPTKPIYTKGIWGGV